jgi:hypothetical protein
LGFLAWSLAIATFVGLDEKGQMGVRRTTGEEEGNGTDQTRLDKPRRSNYIYSAPVSEQVRDDTCAEDHPDIVFCVHLGA